jgi:hypothetical protein
MGNTRLQSKKEHNLREPIFQLGRGEALLNSKHLGNRSATDGMAPGQHSIIISRLDPSCPLPPQSETDRNSVLYY